MVILVGIRNKLVVKILHIGPTRTPHTCDVFKEIKDRTDYKNVVISYSAEKIMSDDFFSDIPVYVYDYLDFIDTPKMREFVNKVLQIEKPDIVVGHCFSQTAVLMNYLLSVLDVPAISFIWGTACCIKNLRDPRFKKIFFDNLAVLKKTNFLLTTNKALTNMCISNYGIQRADFAITCPPVNLAQYTQHIPDVSRPKLLLAKCRYEQFVYPNLPEVFKLFPSLEVHAFRVSAGVSLAKKYGVYKRIIYHDTLPQDKFAALIKKCNIVHTITPDPGTGATAMQASYAGCVNLMRRCCTSAGMIEDNVNAIMCNPNVVDVREKLIYSIKNLSALCSKFKKNNAGLIQYDRENTWGEFQRAVLECLNGTKGKIAPTYR